MDWRLDSRLEAADALSILVNRSSPLHSGAEAKEHYPRRSPEMFSNGDGVQTYAGAAPGTTSMRPRFASSVWARLQVSIEP